MSNLGVFMLQLKKKIKDKLLPYLKSATSNFSFNTVNFGIGFAFSIGRGSAFT